MPALLDGFTRLARIVAEDATRPSLLSSVRPLAEDPTRIFAPVGITPDDWQRQVVTSSASRVLLLCSRQSGKSQCMAACALLEALLHPHAEVLIISRTLRQSLELMRKVKELWRGIIGGRVHRRHAGKPRALAKEAAKLQGLVEAKGWDGAALVGDEFQLKVKNLALSLEPPNGSRIVALPGTPDSIVGFSSVTLLLVDEASRVSDAMRGSMGAYQAATEAVHGRRGRMIVASTPFGKRGWFYEAWQRCEKAKAAYDVGIRVRVQSQGRNGAQPHSSRVAQVPTLTQGEEGSVGFYGHTNDGRNSGGPTGQFAGRTPSGLARVAHAGPYTGEDGWLNYHWGLGAEGRQEDPPFETHRVTAAQCPRIPQDFLDEERATIGQKWYSQEYETEFVDAIDSVFSRDLIEAAVQDDGEEEWKGWFE